MSKSMRRVVLVVLGLTVCLLLIGAATPAQARYTPASVKQCLWTKDADNPLQVKPELPAQLKLRGRDYILVRYQSPEAGILGYGVIEVAHGKKCWNPSAEPTFKVDAMLKRLPLPVANRFKQILRQDQIAMEEQQLRSMRAGYPGVPDATLLKWMDGDGDPRSH